MAYGMQISTANGLQSVEEFTSAQEYINHTSTASSGSLPLPDGCNEGNSIAFIRPLDGNLPFHVSFTATTIEWQTPSSSRSYTSNYRVILLRIT